mmetsp:Transcript_9196/g.55849  ORF Transcript_9196/g.55849 Transcript_9196/m.55849 type:complete len:242 (+) Transcript_9196:1425-2150(+)
MLRHGSVQLVDASSTRPTDAGAPQSTRRPPVLPWIAPKAPFVRRRWRTCRNLHVSLQRWWNVKDQTSTPRTQTAIRWCSERTCSMRGHCCKRRSQGGLLVWRWSLHGMQRRWCSWEWNMCEADVSVSCALARDRKRIKVHASREAQRLPKTFGWDGTGRELEPSRWYKRPVPSEKEYWFVLEGTFSSSLQLGLKVPPRNSARAHVRKYGHGNARNRYIAAILRCGSLHVKIGARCSDKVAS